MPAQEESLLNRTVEGCRRCRRRAGRCACTGTRHACDGAKIRSPVIPCCSEVDFIVGTISSCNNFGSFAAIQIRLGHCTTQL
jgi:hypothetical protein